MALTLALWRARPASATPQQRRSMFAPYSTQRVEKGSRDWQNSTYRACLDKHRYLMYKRIACCTTVIRTPAVQRYIVGALNFLFAHIEAKSRSKPHFSQYPPMLLLWSIWTIPCLAGAKIRSLSSGGVMRGRQGSRWVELQERTRFEIVWQQQWTSLAERFVHSATRVRLIYPPRHLPKRLQSAYTSLNTARSLLFIAALNDLIPSESWISMASIADHTPGVSASLMPSTVVPTRTWLQ